MSPSPRAAPIEVPTNATISFLTRAIGRTLGGHLEASRLFNANHESIDGGGGDRSLQSLGFVHNSYVLMETEFFAIPNFGSSPFNPIRSNPSTPLTGTLLSPQGGNPSSSRYVEEEEEEEEGAAGQFEDADPAATASLSKFLPPPLLRRVGTKEPTLLLSPPLPPQGWHQGALHADRDVLPGRGDRGARAQVGQGGLLVLLWGPVHWTREA